MLGIIASAIVQITQRTIQYIEKSTTTSTTILYPTGWQVGDIVVLFQSNTGAASDVALPANFTNIILTSSLSTITTRASFRIIDGTDTGSISIASTGTERATMFLLRPNFTVTSIDDGTPSGNYSAGIPANISITGPSTATYPHIMLGHYASTGAIITRSSSVTMTEQIGPSTSQYIKYKIYNQGDSSETILYGMSDGGGNTLQGFYLRFS